MHWLVALLLFISGNAFALKSGRVVSVSSSGKTIILNKGSLEGLKQGTRAQIVVSRGTREKPLLVPVADAQAIKVNEDVSYWYLKKVNHKVLLRPKMKLLYIEKPKDGQGGKRKLRVSRKQVVYESPKSLESYIHERNQGVPNSIVYKERKFRPLEKTPKEEYELEEDVDTVTFDGLSTAKRKEFLEKYMKEVESKSLSGNRKLPTKKQIKNKINDRVENSKAMGLISKVNNLPGGIDELYEKQERDRSLGEIQSRPTILSSFEQDSHEKQLLEDEQKRSVKNLSKRGKSWSSGMNDEELRKYFIYQGITSETERQKHALSELMSHEVLFFYHSSIVDHTNADDENHQGQGYSFGVGYEYYFSRLDPEFLRWSAEAFLIQTSYKMPVSSVANGRMIGPMLKLGINYYLYNTPSSIRKFVWFAGLGVGRGIVDMGSETLESLYQYNLLSFPAAHIGFKFRFSGGDEAGKSDGIGLGMYAKFGYENLTYSVVESEDSTIENVDGSFSVADTSLTMGINLYF